MSAQELEELARRQLERARMSLSSRKVETEYLVELGDPAERLLEVAEQRDADLIVVGSRERGFLIARARGKATASASRYEAGLTRCPEKSLDEQAPGREASLSRGAGRNRDSE